MFLKTSDADAPIAGSLPVAGGGAAGAVGGDEGAAAAGGVPSGVFLSAFAWVGGAGCGADVLGADAPPEGADGGAGAWA
jgi:hypothetical protein